MEAARVAVLDAGPCIAVASLDISADVAAEVLLAPFDSVLMPVEVFTELVRGAHLDDAHLVARDPRLEIQGRVSSQDSPTLDGLDLGERRAIELGVHRGARWLVCDDKDARKAARQFNLHVVGTLGLIARAVHCGVLAKARPHFDALRLSEFRCTLQLYNDVLAELGEPPL